jgi:hypothetical protein
LYVGQLQKVLDVIHPLATAADDAERNAFTGSRAVVETERGARNNRRRGREGRRSLKEATSGESEAVAHGRLVAGSKGGYVRAGGVPGESSIAARRSDGTHPGVLRDRD